MSRTAWQYVEGWVEEYGFEVLDDADALEARLRLDCAEDQAPGIDPLLAALRAGAVPEILALRGDIHVSDYVQIAERLVGNGPWQGDVIGGVVNLAFALHRRPVGGEEKEAPPEPE